MGFFRDFHRGAYSMLLPYNCLNNSGDKLSHTGNVISKPSTVNQVVVAAILISTSTYCVRSMYLCMYSVTFILESAGATILAQALLFCGVLLICDNLQTLLGALLFGKVILIGIWRYILLAVIIGFVIFFKWTKISTAAKVSTSYQSILRGIF